MKTRMAAIVALLAGGWLGSTAASPAASGAGARVRAARVPAPPIVSSTWINSPPLAPRDLEGKVVVIEFWTYGCGNCQATVPAMRRLWSDYRKRGVVVIGVHTPEFEAERDPGRVRAAISRQGIPFPVALDNDYRIWKSFGNRYWPAIYVLDADGAMRFTHFGELHVGTRAWRDLTRRMDSLLAERRVRS